MKKEFFNKAIRFKNLAGILLLPANIGGVEGWMAFDTGTMQTALNRSYFPQLEGKAREIGKFDGQVVMEQVERHAFPARVWRGSCLTTFRPL